MTASALLAQVLAAHGWSPGSDLPDTAPSLILEFAYTIHSQPQTRDWPRERLRMYIFGTSQIHAAQPVNPPHRLTPPQSVNRAYSSGVDQLDISPEADFVAQARDLPEIRGERVAAIKAQIQSGAYETPEKLDLALTRLLDEIA